MGVVRCRTFFHFDPPSVHPITFNDRGELVASNVDYQAAKVIDPHPWDWGVYYVAASFLDAGDTNGDTSPNELPAHQDMGGITL